MLDKTFLMVSWVIKLKIICISFTPKNLTYQLTTLGFSKQFTFPLLGKFLMYTISKGTVQAFLTIDLLGDTFPMVSRVTQRDIICKSYTPKKLTYKLTTSMFIELFMFHFLGWFLGYTLYERVGENIRLLTPTI